MKFDRYETLKLSPDDDSPISRMFHYNDSDFLPTFVLY